MLLLAYCILIWVLFSSLGCWYFFLHRFSVTFLRVNGYFSIFHFNYAIGFISFIHVFFLVWCSWISALKFFIKIWKHWQLFLQIYVFLFLQIYVFLSHFLTHPSETSFVYRFVGLISHVIQTLILVIFLFYLRLDIFKNGFQCYLSVLQIAEIWEYSLPGTLSLYILYLLLQKCSLLKISFFCSITVTISP